MLPTAISQILESVGKLVFGLGLARFALLKGYDTATVAAFAGVGLTLGTVLSFLYLLIEKWRFRSLESERSKEKKPTCKHQNIEIWKSLARLSIPMTLGASLVSLTKLIDMTMILRRLQSIGYSEIMANEAYGSYTTLALSVYGLLPTLVNSIALPLLPILSAAIAAGDLEKQRQMIRSSYRLTTLFAMPTSLGVAAYAHPILMLLFGREAEAVAVAAPLLSYLGISVFLSCMITATNSVLHAYQSVNRPIISMLAGAAVKIVSAYFLIGSPTIALLGAPISTFLCNAAVVFFNLWFASKLCHIEGFASIFLRPLASATLSIVGSYSFYRLLIFYFAESITITVIGILTAGILYFLFSCVLGVFRAEEILFLPMGDKVCCFLQKIRLLTPQNDEKRKDV